MSGLLAMQTILLAGAHFLQPIRSLATAPQPAANGQGKPQSKVQQPYEFSTAPECTDTPKKVQSLRAASPLLEEMLESPATACKPADTCLSRTGSSGRQALYMEADASNSSPISRASVGGDCKADLHDHGFRRHNGHSSKLQQASDRSASLATDRHDQSVAAAEPCLPLTPVDSKAEEPATKADLACSQLITAAASKCSQHDPASCSILVAGDRADAMARPAATGKAVALPFVTDMLQDAAPSEAASPADMQTSASGSSGRAAELDGKPGVHDAASPCQPSFGQPQGAVS